MNLLRLLGAASVAVVLVGCPQLAMKGFIKSLVAPANVSSLKVSRGASNQFNLSWVDPHDSDVDHIEISLRSPLTADAPPAPVNVPAGVQKATVTVPFNNVQYIVTVKSVDKGGNKSPGKVYSPISYQTALNSIFGTPVVLLPTAQKPPQFQTTYSTYGPPLGTPTAQTAYLYNSDGTVSRQNYTLQPSGTANGYSTFSYDGRGNLLRQNNYDTTSTFITDYLSYSYDSSGNQLTKYQYSGGTGSSAPTLSGFDQYEYDANGNVVQDSIFDNTSTETNYITYQYDSNGRLLNGTYYLANGTAQYFIVATWDLVTGYPASLNFNDPTTGSPVVALTWSISGTTLNESVYINLFSTANYTEAWTFDTHGLLNQVTLTGTSLSESWLYYYDSSGNMTSEVDNTTNPNTFSQGFGWIY